MSQTKYVRYKYTPDEMSEDEFLKRFVVRNQIFEDIFTDIKSFNDKLSNQHYIIIGQRGQGKTTLLRKIFIEVKNDIELLKYLLPIKFAEEQYQIRSLSRLWEEVADYLQTIYSKEFPDIADKMEEHFEDDDYELKAFSYLEKEIKVKNKKLLILIDNIDELIGKLTIKEQRRLREILLSSSSFKIIGGSTKMLEQHYDYSKPFYEFFKIIKLKGFSFDESKKFLLSLSQGNEKEKIEKIIKETPQRIEIIRRLTGGVPRTLVMLFDIFLDEDGNAFEDLLKILDEVTPLYKHRMDDLPPQLQDIVHTIAINWDGILTKEIAKKTRMESKAISAQLVKLEKYEIVESESVGKNKIYKIKERFFNIWYLMRFGRKKDRQRVEWLIAFLSSWCSEDELENKAISLINKIKIGSINPSYAFHMSEALSYSGLNLDTEENLKNELKKYLNNNNSEFINDLSETDKEILRKAWDYVENNDISKAIKILESSKKSSKFILTTLSEYYIQIDDYINSKKYIDLLYSEFIEQNNANKYLLLVILSMIYVEHEKFAYSYKSIQEFLESEISDEIKNEGFSTYLEKLISKKQYNKSKEFLELEKYNFKEKLKPLWFALMKLMEDEYPHEIKKMGSELEESVNEILEEIKELENK